MPINSFENFKKALKFKIIGERSDKSHLQYVVTKLIDNNNVKVASTAYYLNAYFDADEVSATSILKILDQENQNFAKANAFLTFKEFNLKLDDREYLQFLKSYIHGILIANYAPEQIKNPVYCSKLQQIPFKGKQFWDFYSSLKKDKFGIYCIRDIWLEWKCYGN